eukprot:SAG11_NODE_4_length_33019_cov_28.098909_14_plen_92_part_00
MRCADHAAMPNTHALKSRKLLLYNFIHFPRDGVVAGRSSELRTGRSEAELAAWLETVPGEASPQLGTAYPEAGVLRQLLGVARAPSLSPRL